MRPRAKYAVIYRHRKEYPVSVMCRFFQVSRSGYYDFVHRLGRPEKDAALAEIIAEQRERSFRTYGYRRMWLVAGEARHSPQSQDYPAYHGEIRLARLRSGGAENGSIWGSRYINTKILLNRRVPCGQAQQQMGNGYFLHPYKARRTVSVHDPGSL